MSTLVGTVIDDVSQLTVMACGHCGIVWAAPTEWLNQRRRDGKTFYCPNGDGRVYRESDTDRLKKQVDRLEDSLRWANEMRTTATRDAEHQRRRVAAARGQLTKIKNRIAAGVCPVPGCKRSGLGADVIKHIASCHPQYQLDAEATS